MLQLPILTIRESPELEWILESNILYRVYLLPKKSDLIGLGIDQALAEKIIYRVIDGGETTVIAGKPISYNLLEVYKEVGVDLSLIKKDINTYDFYLLRNCCSFCSHSGTPHPFISGKMELTFTNTTGSDEPLVFDMCPEEVTDPVKVVRTFGVSTEMKFQNISASVGPSFKKVIEYTDLTPLVTAFGKLTAKAGWYYSKPENGPYIRGNREGFIILRSPKGNRVSVKVDVHAQVREHFLTKIIRWIFPTSRKWEEKDFSDMKEMDLPLYRAVPITKEEFDRKRSTEDFADLIQNRQDLSETEKSVTLPSP